MNDEWKKTTVRPPGREIPPMTQVRRVYQVHLRQAISRAFRVHQRVALEWAVAIAGAFTAIVWLGYFLGVRWVAKPVAMAAASPALSVPVAISRPAAPESDEIPPDCPGCRVLTHEEWVAWSVGASRDADLVATAVNVDTLPRIDTSRAKCKKGMAFCPTRSAPAKEDQNRTLILDESAQRYIDEMHRRFAERALEDPGLAPSALPDAKDPPPDRMATK